MKFSTVKLLSTLLLYLALALFLGTAFSMYRAYDAAAKALITGAFILMAAAVAIRLIWARCPHCHCRISYKNMNDTACPYCRKNLME